MFLNFIYQHIKILILDLHLSMATHLQGVKKSTLTDEMRKALCEHKNEHPSSSQKDLQQWVQQKFGLFISQSTVSNTLKRSAEYLSKEITNSNVKRHKSAKYPELEKVLYEWFIQYQEKVNMTGEMIQTKAKEFLRKMYGDANPEFNFSSGWLERFKARYGIKSYRKFGESGSVLMENIEETLPQIRAKLDQFHWRDIYNMDETGLFYRLQADHSLATKQLEGRKKDKERLTVAVCCNGDGSDKVPLWIIGKYANPRCFKNVNINNLNCHYRANKKAWMTGLLFQEFVRWFDDRMKGRKVLLIVDNCPAHPKVIEGLRNVEMFFLPPNTTSKIQPCDAGIIRTLKVYYRRRFYSSILEGYEMGAINPEKINVLDAINFLNAAWNIDVKATTVSNCFRHCKIRMDEDMHLEEETGDDEGIQRLEEVISNLHYRNAMNVEQILNYPNESEAFYESPTDEEIIQGVMDGGDDDHNQDQDDSNSIPQVSPKEAFFAVETLKNYLLQNEKDVPNILYALQKIKDEIELSSHEKKKQFTIDSYFRKA